MSEWLKKLEAKLLKLAVDKLSDEELNANTLPPVDDTPQQGSAIPVSNDPMVFNNKYLVKTDNTEFIVKLTPEIVGQDEIDSMPLGQDQQDLTNPTQNPELLNDWLKSSEVPTKPYEHNEQGTVDPLSKEEELNPSIKVHKQASILVNAEDYQNAAGQDVVPAKPGADKSNPYPPCKYCANYIAETGECAQGLDVEKVQAAKSCSWLNANFSPFGKPKDPEANHDDAEIFNSDPSSSGNSGQMEQNYKG